MRLDKLAKVLNREFGPPFVDEEIVEAIFTNKGTLRLKIGPRDIHIDNDGLILGSGTELGPRLIMKE